jgi:hypothetical protein
MQAKKEADETKDWGQKIQVPTFKYLVQCRADVAPGLLVELEKDLPYEEAYFIIILLTQTYRDHGAVVPREHGNDHGVRLEAWRKFLREKNFIVA